MMNIFLSIRDHATNHLSSFNVQKGFKTIFQDNEKKMKEIMEKIERSYPVYTYSCITNDSINYYFVD